MGRRHTSRKRSTSLPVLAERGTPTPRKRNYARWRALSLSLVYVVFAIHIIHWKLSGRTLAPLELNEVMYTLELGIITAGFLFMVALVVGTLIFGRFFCSWACHIMVLQDLCAWLLRKLRIRRKPIRSRLLLLVPPLTALYMFVWPQVLRTWESRALPTFHLRTDREGWASFVTENFWRNLPSAPVIVLTFLVCGFLIVYLLGSRTFCTYVCPYGAVFALADRFSPARIVVNDRCKQCARCTAACTCGIRVHDEVRIHGMIVNPACLKCLDCVAACQQDALRYAFAGPSLLKSRRSGGRFGNIPYDYSWKEEALMAAVFLAAGLSLRGLYSRIPFLLALAMGVIAGFVVVTLWRLGTRSDLRIGRMQLKSCGCLTVAGRAFAVATAAAMALLIHSGFVRYHEYRGLREAAVVRQTPDEQVRQRTAAFAQAHLLRADRWGLIRNERVENAVLRTAAVLQDHPTAEAFARRILARAPCDLDAQLRLARTLAATSQADQAERAYRQILAGTCTAASTTESAMLAAHQELGRLLADRGDFPAAAEQFSAATGLKPDQPAAWAALGSALAEAGRLADAEHALRTAVTFAPTLPDVHYNHGTILSHLGRFDEAVTSYRSALSAGPETTELHNNLGFALWRLGRIDGARRHLERAVLLDPGNADGHFNLGRLLLGAGERDRARGHLETAARLKPQYARLLGGR